MSIGPTGDLRCSGLAQAPHGGLAPAKARPIQDRGLNTGVAPSGGLQPQKRARALRGGSVRRWMSTAHEGPPLTGLVHEGASRRRSTCQPTGAGLRKKTPTHKSRLATEKGVYMTSLLKTSGPEGPTCEYKGEELTHEGRGSRGARRIRACRTRRLAQSHTSASHDRTVTPRSNGRMASQALHKADGTPRGSQLA